MKPKHQSQSLKQLALKNIKRKHKVIKNWIANGIPYLVDKKGMVIRDSDGEKVLDFYPTSLRKFYAWNGTQNSDTVKKKIGNIMGTGTTTLDTKPDLKGEITADLETLKKKAKIQLENANKTSELQRVTSHLELEKMQRSSAESKYLSMVLEHEKLKIALHNEERAKKQSIRQLTKTVTEKDLEIEKLKASLSELRKSFSKIEKLQVIDK